MLARLRKDFRHGRGIATAALIPFWAIGGLALAYVGVQMGSGVATFSGTVSSVDRHPPDGEMVAFSDGSHFFVDDPLLHNDADTNGVLLPDLRPGDRVDLLYQDDAGRLVLELQSARGSWREYPYGLDPFTPRTWWLHGVLQVALFVLAAAALLLAAASTLAWIPRRTAPVAAAAADPARAAPHGVDEARAAANLPYLPGVAAIVAAGFVALYVTAQVGQRGLGCEAGPAALLVPVILVPGGIATLVMGSRAARRAGSGAPVAGPRALGVICIILAPVVFVATAIAWLNACMF